MEETLVEWKKEGGGQAGGKAELLEAFGSLSRRLGGVTIALVGLYDAVNHSGYIYSPEHTVRHDAGCPFTNPWSEYHRSLFIFLASSTDSTHASRTAWQPPKYSVWYHTI